MSVDDHIVEIRGFKYVKLKTGRHLTFWDCLAQAKAGRSTLSTGISRAIKTSREDFDLEQVEWLLDDVQTYVSYIRSQIEEWRGIKTQEERIALLRKVDGRTPQEAAEFLRKANELESALRGGGG